MTHKITGTVSNHGGVSYRIRAFRADTGAYLAEAMSNTGDGTYTVNLTYTGAVMATMDRDYAARGWSADAILASDFRIIPATPNGHYYADLAKDDANYSNVSLLLPMRGANGSTVFTDYSLTPKTITANGDAKISTAQSKYYGSSGLFDGSGDYLSIGHNSSFEASGNFTFEAYIYPVTTGEIMIASKRPSTPNTRDWQFWINASRQLDLIVYTNGGAVLARCTGITTVPTNTWSHATFVRNGNNWIVFLDGQIENDVVGSGTYGSGGANLEIGRTIPAPSLSWNGHLADIRITNGVARYTANFTPPNQFTYKTGATEPTWPTTGGNVVDNEITWTDQGEMSIPRIEGPIIPVPV